jgi:hypothetical protein
MIDLFIYKVLIYKIYSKDLSQWINNDSTHFSNILTYLYKNIYIRVFIHVNGM